MVATIEVVEVVLEFIAVTIITIITERYLSDTWAFTILGACLVGLGMLHKEWLTAFAQENRAPTIMICTVVFGAVGFWMGMCGNLRHHEPPPFQMVCDQPLSFVSKSDNEISGVRHRLAELRIEFLAIRRVPHQNLSRNHIGE